MLATLLLMAALGAEPAGGDTAVQLINNTGNQQLSISMDNRPGCEAAAKGGHCSFQAPSGFHHFVVRTRGGERMEKALYVSADNDLTWTVEGRDLPGASRWSPKDRRICKVRSTPAGIAQTYCATQADWDADNTRLRQDMMVKQVGFCGGGKAC